MMEYQTIDGRKATIIYLGKDFSPVDKEDAVLIKIVYDDGDTAWLVSSKAEDDEEPSLLDEDEP